MVNIFGISGGGITSDEVTATRANVLKGTTTITSDSNDEVVEGTLENYGSVQKYKTYSIVGNQFIVGIPVGGYTYPLINDYPGIYIPLADLRNMIGYTDASKVLTGTTIAGLEGTMPNCGKLSKILSINETYTLPTGYYSGGSVTQNITKKSAETYRANTVAAQTISSGQYLSGNQTIAKINEKSINACAYTAIGGNTERTSEESFTMPEYGTVFYDGVSLSHISGNCTCRIYRNGNIHNNRDITNGDYAVRGTMTGLSFRANKGDVIKVECTSGAAGPVFAWITARIIW